MTRVSDRYRFVPILTLVHRVHHQLNCERLSRTFVPLLSLHVFLTERLLMSPLTLSSLNFVQSLAESTPS